VIAIAALLTALTYSNALDGQFVYDDKVQILRNPTIQHPQYLWRALRSDVWAFKANPGEARSNYWRPLFVSWLALNFRLFGTDPTGWHALNILAHLLATLLGYWALVRLGLRLAVCAIATWLFATHPVHVQSVAWISGVPDILVSVFLLGSFLCFLTLRLRPRWSNWAAALLLYCAALLSKEIAVTFPAVLFGCDLILNRNQNLPRQSALRLALQRCLPFCAAALLFLALRYQVLHAMQILAPAGTGFASLLPTLPGVLWFYVWQTCVPFALGPIHGVRPVSWEHLGVMNFLVPLAALLALGFFMVRAARRKTAYRLGLIWFWLPLAPALNLGVFLPEMLVQERYLYLPLLGALMMIAEGLVSGFERFRPARPHAFHLLACLIGLALALGCAGLARRYNRVWHDNITLWEHAIRIDPSSSHAYAELGDEYQRAGRLAEAKQTLARALELRPDLTIAHISLGIIANRERRYRDAEGYLQRVLAVYPSYDVALEQLAVAYQQQGKFDQAIALFLRGRRLLSYKWEIYTINAAILEAQAGRKRDALAELESLIPKLGSATDPNVLKTWYFLGELYREQGRTQQAAATYRRYLQATQSVRDPAVDQIRRLAAQSLQRLQPPPESNR
jgi:tetratricopeptide (TPR) repeat protein